MIIFFFVEIAVLALVFGAWFLNSEFLSIGYYAFHMYPMVMGVVAYVLRYRVRRKPHKKGTAWFVLLLPFLLWLAGVWWIYEFQQMTG